MAIVRYRLDPNNAPKMTPEQQARLDALTDEEITAAALSDPDNPPLTDEEIERFAAARLSKTIRDRLSLTQEQFAERFHISYGRLRDLEQGRTHPDSALLAYLKVIEHDPEAVLRVLSAA
ncbi:helix-turn-helix domain-containing protein [Devosia geojensis]